MSIGTKIAVLLLMVCGLGFYIFTSRELESTVKQYREATEEPLVDFAYLLSSIIERAATADSIITPELRTAINEARSLQFSAKVYNLTKEGVDLRVLVFDKAGIVRFDSEGGKEEGANFSQWNDVIHALRGEYGARTSRASPDAPNSTLYISAPIRRASEIIGGVTVVKSNKNANLFIQSASRSTTYLGVVTFLGVAILIAALSFFVTRPIRHLTAYAQAIRDGRPSKLPVLPKGEMRDLGQSLEEMRIALQGKDYVERYVQTITHELKSPITAIKGAAELLQEDLPSEERVKFLKNLTAESSRIEGLIKKLLTLVSIERGGERVLENFPAINLLEEAKDGVAAEASPKNVTVEINCARELMIGGDYFWLLEALKNIVANAVQFSPPNSVVTISATMENQRVYLSVSDSGPGIPEWALEKVCDQFFSLPRPESNKRSTGLGLSIVKEIADRHGALLQFQGRSSGGLIVRMGPLETKNKGA